jgi:hypothetical protein
VNEPDPHAEPPAPSPSPAPTDAPTDVPTEAATDVPTDVPADAPVDPVMARRAQIARWVLLGKRIGYGALALAVAVFSVALYWDLPRILIGIIVACLVVACVTLAPSIVFGYGVMAADREDRQHGNPAPRPRGHT